MIEGNPGFLGRWARRKTDVLQGKPVKELSEPAQVAAPNPAAGPTPGLSGAAALAPGTTPTSSAQEPELRKLSLEDVRDLTQASDFKPFMAQGVGPEIRNAAMKKLFADPHFNVMDGLDTYIDDYSKSDPIPEAMLRQMTSAKFLGLFEEDEKDKQDAFGPPVREDAPPAALESMTQSAEGTDADSLQLPDSQYSAPALAPDASARAALQEHHANTDLRLQPDHAATAAGAGRSA